MSSLFLSCDWGTTFLRLRLIDASSFEVLAESRSKRGAFNVAERGDSAKKRAEAFEKALVAAIGELEVEEKALLSGTPVAVSGMASSSIGWRELPYAVTPFSLDGKDLSWVELPELQIGHGASNRVFLISGVRTADDIMRGEETELLGLFRLAEYQSLSEECLVVLPGSHCKHINVRSGVMEDFRTYMTGELYEVLGTASVLRHSVIVQGDPVEEWLTEGPQAFCEGLQRSQEEALSHLLFLVRTNQVLGGLDHGKNAFFLSGALIGAELRDCRERYGLEYPIIVRAPHKLRELYEKAFDELGFTGVQIVSVEEGNVVAARGQHFILQEVVQ